MSKTSEHSFKMMEAKFKEHVQGNLFYNENGWYMNRAARGRGGGRNRSGI